MLSWLGVGDTDIAAEGVAELTAHSMPWPLAATPYSLRTGRQRGRGVDVEVAAEGVAVTLIDFTLSRLVTPDGTIAFCDLEADPELFNGPKGDCQACTTRILVRGGVRSSS